MKLLLTLLICTLVSIAYAFSQSYQPDKPKYDLAQVTKVTDGDTIEVKYTMKGGTDKVRLLGIDTPELKGSTLRVKCFAYGAMGFTEKWLLGRMVSLESDPSQDDKDRYGRILRYVLLPNLDEKNSNFNEWIIKKGFAYEYTYDKPYKYQKEFKAAQKYAEESKWGLWDSNECKN